MRYSARTDLRNAVKSRGGREKKKLPIERRGARLRQCYMLRRRVALPWCAASLRAFAPQEPPVGVFDAPRLAPLHPLQTILLVAPVLLFSVIAHEIAHGYAALRQGDRTALEAGRLSWNPLQHIDPYLTILLPLIMLTGSTLAGPSVGFVRSTPV